MTDTYSLQGHPSTALSPRVGGAKPRTEGVQHRGRMHMSCEDSLEAHCPQARSASSLPSTRYYDPQPPYPTAQLQGKRCTDSNFSQSK